MHACVAWGGRASNESVRLSLTVYFFLSANSIFSLIINQQTVFPAIYGFFRPTKTNSVRQAGELLAS